MEHAALLDKGGLHPGPAGVAADGLGQGGALAADIGPRAGVEVDAVVQPGAQDVLAQIARRLALGDGGEQPGPQVGVLLTQVDVSVVRPHGPAGDDHALQQLEGVVGEQLPVLEGARLALVGVAHHALVGAGDVPGLPPLFAHVVGRAAPALDAVGGQHVGDGVALHGQGLAQRPEAADGFIALQAVRVVLPEIPGDETNRLAHVRSPLVELLEHIQNALLAVQMAVYHAVDPHGGGHVAGPEAGDLLDGKAAVIGHLAHLQI